MLRFEKRCAEHLAERLCRTRPESGQLVTIRPRPAGVDGAPLVRRKRGGANRLLATFSYH